MYAQIEAALSRHRNLRAKGVSIVSVVVAAEPDAAQRVARGAPSCGAEATLDVITQLWVRAATPRIVDAGLDLLARATARTRAQIDDIVRGPAPGRALLIGRASGDALTLEALRCIVEVAHARRELSWSRLDLLEAFGRLAVDRGLCPIVVSDPVPATASVLLHLAERCPRIDLIAFVGREHRLRVIASLSATARDRWRDGEIIAASREPSRQRTFEESAGGYATRLGPKVREHFAEAARLATVDADRARSEAERTLFYALESIEAGCFELNAVLPGVSFGGRDAEIDLYSHGLRIALEVDGYHHFAGPDAYRRDRRKDVLLQMQGLLVCRVRAEDVMNELDAVLETVRSLLRGRRERLGGERNDR